MIMAEEKKEKPKAKEKKPKEKKKYIYKKGKSCPKCGAGTRLAEHKNRYSCGKCGYYEKR